MDDLGNSLQGLVAAAQMTMSSVHNLETAILLQPSYQWYLSEIPILRHNLAHHWNEIVDVLQGSYKLVNDLFTICQSMGRHSYLSRIQFLQTYMNSISTVETNWQASITRNDDIQLHFASTTVRFNEQGQTNSDLARLPPPPVAPGLSAEVHQFVQMSLAAANPALHPSLSGTAESLKDTHEHLTTLGQFWSGLTSICKSALPGTPRVTAPRRFEAQCESYFSSWHVHRHDLLDAICSLELLVDAISIRAPQKISSKHLRSTSNAPTTITLASRHLNLTSPTSNHNNTLPSQSFTTTYRTYHPSPSEDDFPRLCFPFCGGFRR